MDFNALIASSTVLKEGEAKGLAFSLNRPGYPLMGEPPYVVVLERNSNEGGWVGNVRVRMRACVRARARATKVYSVRAAMMQVFQVLLCVQRHLTRIS